VLDSRSRNSIGIASEVEHWVKHKKSGAKVRSISTASTKVEDRRPHTNRVVVYFVVHSWKIDEFRDALVQEGLPTPLYDTCAKLFYEEYYGKDDSDKDDDPDVEMAFTSADGDSDQAGTAENPSKKPKTQIPVKDIFPLILSRYAYTGGSARWMFNYSKESIDDLFNEYCNSANNLSDILKEVIGPTSEASTNYFFGSSRTEKRGTEYFLVSKRAVEVLAEKTSGEAFKALYHFAEKLANPSFYGWIVEADFFSQVDKAQQSDSKEFKATTLSPKCCSFHPGSHSRL
jgi:hypothetical protein